MCQVQNRIRVAFDVACRFSIDVCKSVVCCHISGPVDNFAKLPGSHAVTRIFGPKSVNVVVMQPKNWIFRRFVDGTHLAANGDVYCSMRLGFNDASKMA